VSLFENIFVEEIEGLPQTPLLKFRKVINYYSFLIQKAIEEGFLFHR